jgi:hypothetical protein
MCHKESALAGSTISADSRSAIIPGYPTGAPLDFWLLCRRLFFTVESKQADVVIR